MNTKDFLALFFASVAALYPALGLFYFLLVSRSRLEKRGYRPEYIDVLRKDRRQRLIGIGLVVPILELAAAGIVILFTGPLQSEHQLFLIFMVFLILVLPFPLRDRFITQRRMKELSAQYGEPIVIDLKHEVLHRVFRPSWELLYTGLFIAGLEYFQPGFHIAFIHLSLLWLLYFLARGLRNANRPAVRESYLWTMAFLFLNHALLLFHLINLLRCCGFEATSTQVACMVGLIILLVAKSTWYMVQAPGFSRALRSES